jgi:ABC-2 type transport system ATP-binding protein
MKLAFGKALIHDAPILVLDEPTSTLDVPSARELREIVRKLNNLGKTVLYTTHIMSEAELLCDRVAIIDRGKLIALGTVEELKASTNKEQVIKVEGVISAQVVRAIEKLPQVSRVVRTAKNGGTRLSVIGANGRGLLPQLIETLSESDAVVQNIVPEEITLEDVFVAETGRSLSEDTRVI